MKANINDNPLRIKKLPKRYRRGVITIDGYDKRTDLHEEDGWRDVITPTYNVETERLGSLVIDNDTITYEVIEIPPKTPQELKAEALANGVTVSNILFSTKTDLNDFITQKNELEKLGLTEMGWGDKDENWLTLTFTEVQNIFIQAMQEFQVIYQM